MGSADSVNYFIEAMMSTFDAVRDYTLIHFLNSLIIVFN